LLDLLDSFQKVLANFRYLRELLFSVLYSESLFYYC